MQEEILMYKGLILIIAGLIALPLPAQEDANTLLSGKIEHGGFGGPHLGISGVNGEAGIFTGAQGGWIINHAFVLGLGGYTLQNEVKGDVDTRHLEMDYGGFQFTYIPRSDRLIHPFFQVLLGTGTAYYSSSESVNNASNHDWFWVIQPAIAMELNVVTFFRASLVGSYRIVQDVELPNLSNSDISGFGVTLLMKFGKF